MFAKNGLRCVRLCIYECPWNENTYKLLSARHARIHIYFSVVLFVFFEIAEGTKNGCVRRERQRNWFFGWWWMGNFRDFCDFFVRHLFARIRINFSDRSCCNCMHAYLQRWGKHRHTKTKRARKPMLEQGYGKNISFFSSQHFSGVPCRSMRRAAAAAAAATQYNMRSAHTHQPFELVAWAASCVAFAIKT